MSPSLGELAESWLTIFSSRRHSPEWHDNACRSLRRSVIPVFGHLPPEQLSRRDIARFIARMVEDDEHPGKANHVLINLRSVYKWALNTGRLDCANPARDIQRQSLKPRERFLTLAELPIVWHLSRELHDFGAVLRLLLLTGCRAREIGRLQWSEVNREARQIELPSSRTKNRRPHIVPLSDLAMAQLPEPRPGRPFLFGQGRFGFDGFSPGMRAMRKLIELEVVGGMPSWSPHDTRRTFSTHMHERGMADPHIIEACLNHIGAAKAGVAGTYNRAAYARQKREAMNAWAAFLGPLVGERIVGAA